MAEYRAACILGSPPPYAPTPSHHRHLLGWQNSLGVAVLKALTSLIAGLLGLWGLGTLLSRSGSSEQPALTASLTNRQRALLGLPLQPQSASETAGAAPGRGPLPAQIPHASLTPPLVSGTQWQHAAGLDAVLLSALVHLLILSVLRAAAPRCEAAGRQPLLGALP